ncbi:MAG: fibronectin type III domain-containing protein [Thermodesulfobacteriota bacterium]
MMKDRFSYIFSMSLFGIFLILAGCGGGGGDADTIDPLRPTGLELSAVSSSQIDLEWNASSDNVGVAGYYIYRDGVKAGQSQDTTFSDTGLTQATEYSYTVASYDATGNISDQSISEEEETYPGSINLAPITSPIPKPEFSTIIFITDSFTGGTQFLANEVKDIYILVYWQGGSGSYSERLEVYTPEGSLYQRFEESFTANSSSTTVTVKLPVAGTYITQHAIFGQWTVKVYLDNDSEPVATASITLQQ